MTLWQRNVVPKLDADVILIREIQCKNNDHTCVRPKGLVFKQRPRDPAKLNAWKNMRDPYILNI